MKTIQEEYKERTNMFKEEITRVIQKTFETTHEVRPTVFAMVRKEDKWAIGILMGLDKLFTGDQGKDEAVEVIKKLKEEVKPVAIAFVSEGWASALPIDKMDSYIDKNGNYTNEAIRPISDPNRKEVIMLNFETFKEEANIIWEIDRTDKKPILKETKILPHSIEWQKKGTSGRGGRFTNLLDESYSEFAEIYKNQGKENLN